MRRGPARSADPGHNGATTAKTLDELGKSSERSELGQGSSFWFTLRLEQRCDVGSGRHRIAAELATAPRFSIVQAPTVLLAEDNAVNREVLTEMLATMGCKLQAIRPSRSSVA